MPPWLEAILTPVAVLATFYFLVWLVAREALSPKVRLVGWLSVVVTVASVLWSIGFETVLPAWRRGEVWKVPLALAQPGLAFVGAGVMIAGALRFLRAWLSMGWVISSIRGFNEASRPLVAIRREPDPRKRWRMAGALMLRVLLLPGLGWVLVGFGIVLLNVQGFDMDTLTFPNPEYLALGLGSIALGLVQMLARALGERR